MNSLPRVSSIDILRALTMWLMIWVNDFWTLENVPKWLTHAAMAEDYLGFSDVIFPLFLFIMGLSIPWAVENRRQKGERYPGIVGHILIRSGSLLLMGFFMVNQENIHAESLMIPAEWWGLLMATAMAFIWLDWPRTGLSKPGSLSFQGAGLLLLVMLALIYHGGSDGASRMQPHWWGILGLLGWAYLANALLFLVTRGNPWGLLAVWMMFNGLNLLAMTDALHLPGILRIFSPVLTGATPAFTAAGMLAAVVLREQSSRGHLRLFFLLMMGLAVVSLIYGFGTRPLWGISKIRGTPAWVGICTGLGFVSFAFFYWLADERKLTGWATVIKAAGTSTLTCYLLPYFIYPIRSLTGLRLPEFMRTGLLGLAAALMFSLAVVLGVRVLEKFRIKLKL